jgi:hypothetical protein
MAELTMLESKVGECMGLAMAAQGTGKKVARLAEQKGAEDLVRVLERMRMEAAETEERCARLADGLDEKKTALLEKAREVKKEAGEMAAAYLGSDADALDGLEFMTMAEAGEVGHWEIAGVPGAQCGRVTHPEAGRVGDPDPAAAT